MARFITGSAAAYIFVRSGNTWTLQGNPVSGSEAYYSGQGTSVGLSADGNTLVMGSSAQTLAAGSAWAFIRKNGVWTEQGYLVAPFGSDPSGVGDIVAVSADGNVALVANSTQNAACLFTRTDSVWNAGAKLTGMGVIGSSYGASISISGTGNSAVVGSADDNGGTGASWFYNAPPSAITSPATNVNKTVATLNGLVNDNEALATVSMVYDTTANLANPSVAKLSTGVNPLPAGTGLTKYSSSLSSLDSNTTYYYRVQAAYSGGTFAGDIVSFTTPGQPPAITSFSPETAPEGTLVTINGANFNGTSMVSFGGVPATSYKIISSSKIQAYVGSGNSGSISVATPSGTASLPNFKLITILPQSNFSVTVSSATCIGVNDGSIEVKALQALNYSAVISGGGLNKSYPFTDSLSITSLTAGDYSICINTTNQSTLQQCFDVSVTQPPPLSVFAATNPGADSVSIDMSGANLYLVSLNGISYKILSNTVILPLKFGSNQLSVTTEKPCQGSFTRSFNISKVIVPYPMPFQDQLKLDLGAAPIALVSIVIYNVNKGEKFSKTNIVTCRVYLPWILALLKQVFMRCTWFAMVRREFLR